MFLGTDQQPYIQTTCVISKHILYPHSASEKIIGIAISQKNGLKENEQSVAIRKTLHPFIYDTSLASRMYIYRTLYGE